MSNRNPEVDYSHLPTALAFAFRQTLKRLNSSLPGIVVHWDGAKRRATIQPAIKILTTKGREIVRPAIANVPVLFPQAAEYTLYFELKPGDPVMLLFSQRGLTEFKKKYALSKPDKDGLMSSRDAVAIAGFGAQTIKPVGPVSLQDNAGKNFVAIEKGIVNIHSGGAVNIRAPNVAITGNVTVSGAVTVSGGAAFAGNASFSGNAEVQGNASVQGNADFAGDLAVEGDALTHKGTNIGDDHAHTGVTPGRGTTGPPES